MKTQPIAPEIDFDAKIVDGRGQTLFRLPRKLKKRLKKQAARRAMNKRQNGQPWRLGQICLDYVFWHRFFKCWIAASFTLFGR